MILFIIDPKKIIHSQFDNEIFKEMNVVFSHTLEGLSRINISEDDIIFIDIDNSEFNGQETLDSFPVGAKVISLSENKYNLPWVGDPINFNLLYLNLFGKPYRSGEFIDDPSDVKKVVDRQIGDENITPQNKEETKVNNEIELKSLISTKDTTDHSIIKQEEKIEVIPIIEKEEELIPVIKKDPPESVGNPSIAKSMFEVITDNIRDGNKLIKSLKQDQESGKFISDYVSLSHDKCSDRLPNNIDIDESLRHIHVGFKTKGSKTYNSISKRYGIKLESIDSINQTRFLDFAEELLLDKELHKGDRSYRFNTSLDKKSLMNGVKIKLDDINKSKEITPEPIAEVVKEIPEVKEITPEPIAEVVKEIPEVKEITPEPISEVVKEIPEVKEITPEPIVEVVEEVPEIIVKNSKKQNSKKDKGNLDKKSIDLKPLSISELRNIVGNDPVLRVVSDVKTEPKEKEAVNHKKDDRIINDNLNNSSSNNKKNKNKNKKKNKNKSKDKTEEEVSSPNINDQSTEELLSIMAKEKDSTIKKSESKPLNSEFKPLEEEFKPLGENLTYKENDIKPVEDEFKPLDDEIKISKNIDNSKEFKSFDNEFKPLEEEFKPLGESLKTIDAESSDTKLDDTKNKSVFDPKEISLDSLNISFVEDKDPDHTPEIKEVSDKDDEIGSFTFTEQTDSDPKVEDIVFIKEDEHSDSGTISLTNLSDVGSKDIGSITFNDVSKEDDQGVISFIDASEVSKPDNEGEDFGSFTFTEAKDDPVEVINIEEEPDSSGIITFEDKSTPDFIEDIKFNDESKDSKFKSGLESLSELDKEEEYVPIPEKETPVNNEAISMFNRMSKGQVEIQKQAKNTKIKEDASSMLDLLDQLKK